MSSYIDYHVVSPEGADTLIRIDLADIPPVQLTDDNKDLAVGTDALLIYFLRLEKRLKASGFKPREQKPATNGTAPAEAPVCATCGGPTLDNSAKHKANNRAPLWKCKDRDCDDAAWPAKGGGLRWGSEKAA